MARAFGNGTSNYITFEGFTVIADDGLKLGGIILTGKNSSSRSLGLIAKNINLNGGTELITSTDNRDGIRVEETTGTLIQNCILMGYQQVDDWANTAAIKMYFNDQLVIENTEIYNSTAAIYLKADNDNITIRNNYLHENYNGVLGQVYLTRNSDNNKIYNNVIANSNYIGLGVTQEDQATADNWEIYNNTIFTASIGIVAAKGNWSIWNNIISNTSQYNLWRYDGNYLLESDHNQYGLTLNIINRIYTSQSLLVTNLNDWQNSFELSDGTSPGINSISTDPGFSNVSGSYNLLSDFELTPESLSKNTGRNSADIGANISSIGANIAIPRAPTDLISFNMDTHSNN